MFHSAPQAIHKEMVRAIQNNQGKIKKKSNKRLHTKQGRQNTRRGIVGGRRNVDGKKADAAGRWLRGWFRDHFKWPYIEKRSHRIGLGCGLGAVMGFGLTRYWDHRSMTKSEHAAIQNCVSTAI